MTKKILLWFLVFVMLVGTASASVDLLLHYNFENQTVGNVPTGLQSCDVGKSFVRTAEDYQYMYLIGGGGGECYWDFTNIGAGHACLRLEVNQSYASGGNDISTYLKNGATIATDLWFMGWNANMQFYNGSVQQYTNSNSAGSQTWQNVTLCLDLDTDRSWLHINGTNVSEGGFRNTGQDWNRYHFAAPTQSLGIKEICIWNGTFDEMPSECGTGAVSGITINLSDSLPGNSQADYNDLRFNLTANASESFECRYYLNETINSTLNFSSGSDISVAFNITIPDGHYTYKIGCNTSTDEENSSSYTFYIDTVDPIITWVTPATDNSTIELDGSLVTDIRLTDNNLYSYHFNITDANGTIVFNTSNTSLTGLTAKNITETINISNRSGVLTANLRACDGHTKDEIKDLQIVKSYTSIDFENKISVSDSKAIDTYTLRLKDRYKFAFEYDEPQTQITIELDGNCKYIGDKSGYKGHFVCDDTYWVDFEGDYDVEVNGNTVTVTSSKPLTKFWFDSIGELNCIQEQKEIFVTTGSEIEYPTQSIEFSYSTYTLNITYDPSLMTNVNATLYYNNTPYVITGLNQSSYYLFNTTIRHAILPEALNTTNVTFYWDYYINSNKFNTSNKTEQIYKMMITGCHNKTTRTLNLSFYNFTSSSLINVSFEGVFDVWYQNTSFHRNYSFSITSVNQTGFCIYPSFVNLSSNMTFAYTYSGTLFNYNTFDYTLSNISKSLDLYVVDGTTQVTLNVIDQDDKKLQDVFIYVLAYDTGTNSYKTVERLKTDYVGVAIGNFVLNTQPYKFLLYRNNSLIFESTNTFITSTSRTIRVNLREDYFANYNIYRGITSSLTYTNSTRNFAYTFSEPTGTIHYGCLKVVRRSVNGDTTVNESCLSTSAGSILVNIGNTTGSNTYIATGYVLFDDNIVTDILTIIDSSVWKEVYNDDGIFVSIFMLLGLSTVAVFNPIAAIFLGLIAFVTTNILGFFHMNWQYLISAIIIGAILMFKLGRK